MSPEIIAMGNECQFWLSSVVQLTRFHLLLAVIGITACDPLPGLPDVSASDTRLTDLSITPADIRFTSDAGVRDTTVLIAVRLRVEAVSDATALPTVFVRNTRTGAPVAEVRMIRDTGSPGHVVVTVPLTTSTIDLASYDLSAVVVADGRPASNRITGKVDVTGFAVGQPVIRAVMSPDTVRIPSSPSTFSLRAFVTHPNGPSLIDRVEVDIRNPDGSLLSGSPFRMFDDGRVAVSGDQTANDGIYTRTFQITPSNQPAVYTTRYVAIDRFGTSSATIVKELVFSP